MQAQATSPDTQGFPWHTVRRHTPNALTGARFALTALFVWLLSTAHMPWVTPEAERIDRLALILDEATARLLIAALVFLLAALTDTLDGLLARRWGVQSRLGRIMDPLADKVLVLGAFVLLAGPTFSAPVGPDGAGVQLSGVAAWMVIVILTRELLVTSIRGMFEAEGFDFSAGAVGKWKMIAQSVSVPALLGLVALGAPEPGTTARAWVLLIAWGTTAITAASAWPYIRKAVLASTGGLRPDRPSAPEPDLGAPVDRVEIAATHTRKRAPRNRGGSPSRGPR